MGAIGDVFIYNSLVHIFTSYDRRVMKDYLAEGYTEAKFRRDVKRIITSPEFIVEASTVFIGACIVSLCGGFYEFSGIFRDTGLHQTVIYLFPIILLLPIILIFGIHSRYETMRRWIWLERVGNIESLYSIPRLIVKGFLIFFLYIFVYPFAPMIVLAYLSIVGIIGALIDILTVLGFIAAVLTVIILAFGFAALRSISLRKKLLKQLRTVTTQSGYTLSEIQHPYSSLFKWRKECNFTVSKGDKLFSCRLIGSFWQRAPIYFTSNKHAHYMHRIGTKNHHFDILSQFEYDFEGDGTKLLILNPVPKRAYVSNNIYADHDWYDNTKMISVMRGLGTFIPGGRKKRSADSVRGLEPGDKIWGYGIYNTTSFIAAIDRDCLGRFNGMFE